MINVLRSHDWPGYRLVEFVTRRAAVVARRKPEVTCCECGSTDKVKPSQAGDIYYNRFSPPRPLCCGCRRDNADLDQDAVELREMGAKF
jgi:hypothetical protein